MNEEQQLKVQAFVDGELPEGEARDVAAWLARDAEATALMNELRNTRKALAGFDEPRLPEDRDFYWSKIQWEIERHERAAVPVPTASFFTRLRRILAPAGAVAALAIMVIAAFMQLNVSTQTPGISGTEMTVADAGAFTYRDYENGTTLVWVSFPAESEFAQNSVN